MSEELPDEFQNLSPILSTTKVAELLGMTRAGISNLLNSGDLKGFRAGHLWRIHRGDFLKYIGFIENSNQD